MLINLRNSTGTFKQAKIGFSWVTLFFSFLVPLYRRDWKVSFYMFLLAFFTLGFLNILFAFTYNKKHLTNLLIKGYMPADAHSKMLLVSKDYVKFNQTIAPRSLSS
jgi:hypothetical protein